MEFEPSHVGGCELRSFSAFAVAASSISRSGGQPRTPINREQALSGFADVPQRGIVASRPSLLPQVG